MRKVPRKGAPKPLLLTQTLPNARQKKKCLLGGPITKPMDLAITLCPFLLIFDLTSSLTNMATF